MINILKLTNGQYLIGTVREEPDYYVVEKPEYIHIIPLENQKFGSHIFNLDAIISSVDTIQINKDHVLYMLTPTSEIATQYSNIISPIQLPNTQLVL